MRKANLPCGSPEEKISACAGCACSECSEEGRAKCIICGRLTGTTFLCQGGI